MATLVCNYPLSQHDGKIARIAEVVHAVTGDPLCQPERALRNGGRVFVMVRGMDDTLAIQSKLTLQEDDVDAQVVRDDVPA